MDTATLYDGDVQMFREPDLGALRFLRWLVDRGQLEHEAFGAPSGVLADAIELVRAR